MANKTLEYIQENLKLTSGYCRAEGHVLFSVAGAVTDAAFSQTPLAGTLAWDSTNHKIFVRSATTTWYSSSALT